MAWNQKIRPVAVNKAKGKPAAQRHRTALRPAGFPASSQNRSSVSPSQGALDIPRYDVLVCSAHSVSWCLEFKQCMMTHVHVLPIPAVHCTCLHPSKAMCTHVLPCITMYYHVLPCIAMYYYVLPRIAMFSHVLPCIAM